MTEENKEEVPATEPQEQQETPALETPATEAPATEEALPFWKKFDMDPKEREIDIKSIKALKGIPSNVRDRFKALYMISHQRS